MLSIAYPLHVQDQGKFCRGGEKRKKFSEWMKYIKLGTFGNTKNQGPASVSINYLATCKCLVYTHNKSAIREQSSSATNCTLFILATFLSLFCGSENGCRLRAFRIFGAESFK